MSGADADGSSLRRLQEVLGHRFADPDLLDEALTHSSVASTGGRARRSNERLEFLGDRVLGLVVAQLIFRRFPDESEGDLARRLAALVRREALASVAAEIDLGGYIRVSRGEDEAGGRRNVSLLADTCEAMIAAIYLDGGLAAAETFIARHWKPLMARETSPPKDAKTELQEWAQGRGMDLPEYQEMGREGPPHAPRFSVEVRIGDLTPATATGSSKRAAEQAAAEAMLARLHQRTGV